MVANKNKWTKWRRVQPITPVGTIRLRDNEFLTQFKHHVETVSQAWAKLGQPDFTEVLTKLLQAKPQTLFSLLYAGNRQ